MRVFTTVATSVQVCQKTVDTRDNRAKYLVTVVTPIDSEQPPGPPLTEERKLTEESRRRILEEMEARNITNRDISRKIQLGEGSVGKILLGKTSPTLDNFLGILGVLGLNPSYVLFGIGSKYVADEEGSPSDSSQRLKAVCTSGVDAWLLETHEPTTKDERDWMRSVKWDEPEVRLPDEIYEMELRVYRAMRSFLRDR